ncbi:MAG: hypothetical protein KC431_11110, partial [Myxococcales bacterium]|nr:hypothetical protein [Myxococcales bacterium]
HVVPHDTLAYRGMMCSGVPNMAVCLGYTNASWTLKVDLICDHVCRLLRHMDAEGYAWCMPQHDDPAADAAPFLNFAAGYVQRAEQLFPRQGKDGPWRVRQNYLVDRLMIKLSRIEDGVMHFGHVGDDLGIATAAAKAKAKSQPASMVA